MTHKALFLLLTFFCLCASTSIYSQQNDSSNIVNLIKSDYSTMGNMDTLSHLHNVTRDYFLIENGEVWGVETELDSVYRKYAGSFDARTDYFNFKTIKSNGDMAFGIWHLRSEFKVKGKIVVLNWNESGVFRKESGRWKIALIHSSPTELN